MEIVCPGSVLRALRESDAPSLARHANDRDVWLNLRDRFPHPCALADAVACVALVQGDARPLHFGIVVDGEAAGTIGLGPGTAIARRSAARDGEIRDQRLYASYDDAPPTDGGAAHHPATR